MPRRRVRLHADFVDDVAAQVAWLVEQDRPDWIDGLRRGIDEAIALCESQPGAGVPIDQRDEIVLRKLILRRLPFVVWYAHDEGSERADLWFLRLFHARQDRPRPETKRRRRR